MLQSGRHQPHHLSSRRAHPWHRLRRAISQRLPAPAAARRRLRGGGCGSSKASPLPPPKWRSAIIPRRWGRRARPTRGRRTRSAPLRRDAPQPRRRERAEREQQRRPVRRRVVGGGAVGRRRRRPRAVEAVPLGRLGVGRRAPVRPQADAQVAVVAGAEPAVGGALAAEDEAHLGDARVGDDLDAVGEARRCGFRPLRRGGRLAVVVAEVGRAAHRRRPRAARRVERQRELLGADVQLADGSRARRRRAARAARGSGTRRRT